ncbi:MaoC family dehydratase [Methylobacterium sp. WL9]|uniref:MaoC family dehydratase n=1 Tax=Methylobacterium sp. WL9 TaxID=2603898 RepID=UPI0011C8D5A1|nr:MaoC family dehydratase [Methylobacterium sp. WL9]TXN21726.1 MaoC family dehydratase [Methylobacterium sp. WL9]
MAACGSAAPSDPGGTDPIPDGREAFLADLRLRVGTQIGASAWTVVDQTRIDRFAAATGDHQFVHVDPVRAAAETPFGGTVAHGYLTLAILGGALGEVLPVHPCVRAVLNLGADKVRFLAPVCTGARVRGVFTLNGVSGLPENKAALRLAATMEVAEAGTEAARPALRAELTLMLIFSDAAEAPAPPDPPR